MKPTMKIRTIIIAMIFLPGCVVWHSGVRPIEPPVQTFLPGSTVNLLKPTLTWEPSDLEKSSEVEDLRYSLIVFRIPSFFSRQTVTDYENKDIRVTSHTLETSLEPNTQYYWRVRVIYKKKGQEIIEDWNGFNQFSLFTGMLSSGNPYFFKTPSIDKEK